MAKSDYPVIAEGAAVRVEGWGFDDQPCEVIRHERDGYYALRFAHNGNQVPGFWHGRLVELVA